MDVIDDASSSSSTDGIAIKNRVKHNNRDNEHRDYAVNNNTFEDENDEMMINISLKKSSSTNGPRYKQSYNKTDKTALTSTNKKTLPSPSSIVSHVSSNEFEVISRQINESSIALESSASSKENDNIRHSKNAVLFIGLPDQPLSIGIDGFSFVAADNFKGIYGIPDGVHVLQWNVSGSQITQGMIIVLNKDDKNPSSFSIQANDGYHVYIQAFDTTNEIFKDALSITSSDGNQRIFNEELSISVKYAYEARHFDSGLVDYSKYFSSQLTFANITSYITHSTMRLCGIEVNKVIMPHSLDEDKELNIPSSSAVVDDVTFVNFKPLPSLKEVKTLSQFKGVPSTTWTSVYFDRTSILESLIETRYSGDVNLLLGEFQLSFLLFMTIGSYNGLHQWKMLCDMLCNCGEAIHLGYRKLLFDEFPIILRYQLEYIPNEIFYGEGNIENCFLPESLKNLLETVFGRKNVDVNSSFPNLFQFVKCKFGNKWLMDSDEYLPGEIDSTIKL